MEPEIRNGSTVIGIKVSRSEIKDRKSYVIVSTDGIQCKQIRHDQKSEFLYLISLNTNYPPKHVRKDDVFEVWEVWKIL
ncbi:MAG: S24 family peptidase [Bacteroidetes bacterium]|nr:S24 family peptidase [Bacteroidota bacterium]